MFADDANLIADKNVTALFKKLNLNRAKVSEWFKTNKLSLNVIKAKYTIFCKP